MKLLNAVFSYNRCNLLKNTLDSLGEFGPEGDLLVVDDASNKQDILGYLNLLKERGAAVIRKDRHEPGYHGGLYAGMNMAAQFAIDNDYSHIFFIQDDVQFMWRDNDFPNRLEKIFGSLPDASMVCPIFFKGIVSRSIEKRLTLFPESGCWHLFDYGIADMGIMPVALLKKEKRWFGTSEAEHAAAWRSMGYKFYIPIQPAMGWVPWPEVYNRGFKAAGGSLKPKQKYLLKPLSDSQIAVLKENHGSWIPFHEDFCLPWGWRCFSPYWFTGIKPEYFKLLIKERKFPRLVTA